MNNLSASATKRLPAHHHLLSSAPVPRPNVSVTAAATKAKAEVKAAKTAPSAHMPPAHSVDSLMAQLLAQAAAEVQQEDGDKVNHGWSQLDIAKHSTNTFVTSLEDDELVRCAAEVHHHL